MKISVIIPTYKPQSYLEECLDSLYRQTFPKCDFEILLVLNGCNEPYLSKINHYIKAHDDLNIRLFHEAIGGVSNARNIALDNAHGEYITFLDDDDYVSPTYLEELFNISTADIIGLVYPYAFNDSCPDKQIENYGMTLDYNRYAKRGLQDFTTPSGLFSGPCMKLIHKDVIGNRRFNVNFRNGEDSLFMFLISDRIGKVVFTSTNAIYYRRYRDGSAVMQRQKAGFWIKNTVKLIFAYTKIYLSGFPRYNFNFYITRLFASFHILLFQIGRLFGLFR